MYHFLVTPRWLAAAALAVAAAAVMVLLGNWQYDRYQERSAINARIDAADTAPVVPLTSQLTAPATAGVAGSSPGKRAAWTRVTATGRYDTAHEIQVRGRTVDGDVGFEIVTPLLLDDGTAVLIDRGWVPAPPGGAVAAPTVPPAPAGQVTVIGQIHLSESRPTPIRHRDGRLDTRRISLPRLAPEMPFPLYGAYVLLAEQTPAADPAFTRVPIDHEDAWQNGGYTVQWYLFALMTLFAYGWYARREALVLSGKRPRDGGNPTHPATSQPPRSGDRVEEADRRRATAVDRVEEADRRRATPADRADEADHRRATSIDRVEEADRRAAPADRAGETERRRATAVDRADEADRRRATSIDRVEQADHRRTTPVNRAEETDLSRTVPAERAD